MNQTGECTKDSTQVKRTTYKPIMVFYMSNRGFTDSKLITKNMKSVKKSLKKEFGELYETIVIPVTGDSRLEILQTYSTLN